MKPNENVIMYKSYDSFLNFRAAQRRITARFSRPHWLTLHTTVFVSLMCGIWYGGNVYYWWRFPENYTLPVLIGFVWSFLLAGHALWTYRRSAAGAATREQAVVAEIQQFVQQSDVQPDPQTLIEMHQQLEDSLERQGHAVIALTVFALINVLTWFIGIIHIGSSFAFQMTWPIALIVVGGINAFSAWQQQNRNGQHSWFARFPLRHLAAYVFGVAVLGIIGAARLVNYWDVNNIVSVWTLLLLTHAGFGVIVLPLWQHLTYWTERPAKPKRSEHMLLDDDGELVDFVNDKLSELTERLAAHDSPQAQETV